MFSLTFAASLAVFVPTASAGPAETPTRTQSPLSTGVAAAETAASVDAAAASHCARAAELLGSNCSYTTGMMARRVLEEGQDWGAEGSLTPSPNNLGSMVAAPYTLPGSIFVIANELIEVLSVEGHTKARLALSGKLLEVDGVRYVVLTSYRVINT